jgi:GH24 family phage-related lysozyme (muramidase)
MNIDKLREELKEDEGCKYEIYLDHLGLPTHGIGHLSYRMGRRIREKSRYRGIRGTC